MTNIVYRPKEKYPNLSSEPSAWTARVGEHDMLKPDIPRVDMAVEKIIVYPYRSTGICLILLLLE